DGREEAGGGAHRDRPRRSAVAGGIEAPDDDHRHETSAGVDGDRALGVTVAGRIRTRDSRHSGGGGIHGPRPCGGEEDPHQAQDRSPRPALARALEPDELLSLGFRERRPPRILGPLRDLHWQDPLVPAKAGTERYFPPCATASREMRFHLPALARSTGPRFWNGTALDSRLRGNKRRVLQA